MSIASVPLHGETASAQPLIGAPVHARRLLREVPEQARTAAEPSPDFPCLPDNAKMGAFGLAGIGELITGAAREQRAGRVQDRNTTAAIPPVCMDGTDEPRPAPAEMAGGPGNRHSLPDVPPRLCPGRAGMVEQQKGIRRGLDHDFARRLVAARPCPTEALARPQAILSPQMPDIKREGRFARVPPAKSVLRHPSPAADNRNHLAKPLFYSGIQTRAP
jgi:hypothetical protein